jgi:hypothetical protein
VSPKSSDPAFAFSTEGNTKLNDTYGKDLVGV